MTKTLQIISLLLYCVVAVTFSKHTEDTKSRLLLDFDWPEPKKNLQRFPHGISCSHFYVLKPDGSQAIKQCPENELFDYRTLRCREKTLAKCWNDILKKDDSKKRKKQFNCPFPWGVYPDPEDCSMFYDCLSGIAYPRKCPDSFLFDKAESKCVEENEAMCADHTDIVEPDYKCPFKWGFFTHSKDCSKYYECLRKVPSLRSCKKNMLFDNFKRECLPKSNVDCGERINPYGGVRPTTERIHIDVETVAINKTLGHENMMKDHLSTEQRITDDRFSSGDPRTTNIRFSTGYPRTTDSHLSTGNPKMTSDRLSTEYPRTMSARFSTGNPRTTDVRFSTGYPRTTDARFSTVNPRTTDNHFSSGNKRTTDNHFSSGNPRMTDVRFSTGYQRTTDARFSTGNLRTTDNHFSSENPRTTDKHFSSGNPRTTGVRFSTGHPRATDARLSTINLRTTSDRFSTGNQRMTDSRFSTEYPKMTRDRFSTGNPRTTDDHFSTGNPRTTGNRFSTSNPKATNINSSTGNPRTTNFYFSTENSRMTSNRLSSENPKTTNDPFSPKKERTNGSSGTSDRFSTDFSTFHISSKDVKITKEISKEFVPMTDKNE